MLNGFIDSLLQSFENHRAGLTDAMLGTGDEEAFFRALYEKEAPRLREIVRQQELALSDGTREEFFQDVDEYVRGVVLPAYTRLAARFTRRERNDFYLLPEPLHGAERLGWGIAGMLLGLFVVWAPFIPLWAKEWVLVFTIGGLVFPNIRRFLALRRYESDLNRLVTRADDEIWRKDLAYVTEGATLRSAPPGLANGSELKEPKAEGQDAFTDRLKAATGAPPPSGSPKPRAREGGR